MKPISPAAPIFTYLVQMRRDVGEQELYERFLTTCADEIRQLYEHFLVFEALRVFSEGHPDVANVSIDTLGLNPRALATAKELCPDGTIARLLLYSAEELRAMPGMGEKSVNQILNKLQELGAI